MITPKAYFPVLVADDLLTCKHFFSEVFGFKVVYDTDWYIHLAHQTGAQLGFLVPNHPSQPEITKTAFQGKGLIYSFEVDDVDAAFSKISEKVEVLHKIKTEDWGQRHFLVSGPAGLIIDVIQNVDPSLDAT